MAEIQSKASDTPTQSIHPYNFAAFQNYCCGPRAQSSESSSFEIDRLPISNKFKTRVAKVVEVVNQCQKEYPDDVVASTSRISHRFFDSSMPKNYHYYLIDRPMSRALHNARVLNWMTSLRPLYPIRTSGNGNCLLHAVLISITGTHDFDLLLRDQLIQYIKRNEDQVKTTWKEERLRTDKTYAIQSEEEKLDTEWKEIRDLVNYEVTEDGQPARTFKYLEGIHVFSIANMLRRPIIILSEDVVRNDKGEMISYNDLYGIYLPIWTDSKRCHQVPIVLAYDRWHFSPLLSVASNDHTPDDNYLPLHQSFELARTGLLLPLRFVDSDMPSERTMQLLKSYLYIDTRICSIENDSRTIPVTCTKLGDRSVFDDCNLFVVYYDYLVNFHDILKQQREVLESIQAEQEQRGRDASDKHIQEQDQEGLRRNKCVQCQRRTFYKVCAGCQRSFCSTCAQDHQDNLRKQFQAATDTQNDLYEMLVKLESASKSKWNHPCVIEINRWEKEMIDRIKNTAKTLRQNVDETSRKNLNEFRRKLDKISADIKQAQATQGYLENQIHTVERQCSNLRTEIISFGKDIQLNRERMDKLDWTELIYITKVELKEDNNDESQANGKRPSSGKISAQLSSENDPRKRKEEGEQKSNVSFDTLSHSSSTSSLQKLNGGKENKRICERCRKSFHGPSTTVLCPNCYHRDNYTSDQGGRSSNVPNSLKLEKVNEQKQ